MDFSNFWWQATGEDPGPGPGPGPDAGDPIGQSLRFTDNVVTRPQSNGALNNTNWCCSFWVKNSGISKVENSLFVLGDAAPQNWFITSYVGVFMHRQHGNGFVAWNPEAAQRDPSAWYHCYLEGDTSNKVSLWINGEKQPSNPTFTGMTKPICFGHETNVVNGQASHAYFAQIFLVGGQRLGVDKFARRNSSGVWVPVDPTKEGGPLTTTAAFGANGFHLTFEDPSNVGKDYSGNGNDFTAINFELVDQSSPEYDLMQDSPTQNYATWNPLVPGRTSYVTDANLRATAAGTTHGNCQTINLNDGNSYYWEWTSCSYTSNASGWILAGTLPFKANFSDNSMRWNTTNRNFNNPTTHGTYSSLTITGDQAITADTTYGFTYNNGTLQVLSNGTVTCTISNIPTDEGFYFGSGDNANTSTSSINFGQQPFLYTPPSGFEALQTQNLPAATIANGRDHFQAITDAGANILTAAQTAFPDGLWWIKDRVNSNQHQLVDSIDGTTSCRQLNAGTTGAYVAPAGNSVAWCWNWDQADPQANGFNIIEFNASGDPVIDTGLAYPEFLFYYSTKSANTFAGFRLLGNGFFELNSSQQFSPSSTIQWQTGANAGEVKFNGARIGGPGKLFAWQSVPNYSAFGSYTGNGDSGGDGPFIYTGMKIGWLIIKQANGTDSWAIEDTTRNPSNPNILFIQADSKNPEESQSGFADVDFLSNGFKIRNSWGKYNASGKNYVYAAFAENPFQAPATAR